MESLVNKSASQSLASSPNGGVHHIARKDWLVTPDGAPRGYIQPDSLDELWFHTGTRCNLGCWFCLEGSGPLADRLQNITLEDARPFIDEAVELGVKQFSFTGGEPFVNDETTKILSYALDNRSCLVLTNGTRPLRDRFEKIKALKDKPNRVKFRVSLDHPDPEKHDEVRGQGNFMVALKSLAALHREGFDVSIARHQSADENAHDVNRKYQHYFEKAGLPPETGIVSFPELHRPGDSVEVPHITENCMTTFKDEQARAAFMCNYSKMVIEKDNQMRVYACTLVDDDPDYDLGGTLTESMKIRVMLRHHRCFSCFAAGTSCSEG